MGGARPTAAQRRMLQHGLIILLLGLLSGFGLAWSAIGAIDLWPLPIQIPDAVPGAVDIWLAAHSGNLMNGLMAIGVALSFGYFDFTARSATLISWCVVGAIWGNACFYVFRLWAPNRGLSIGDNAVGEGNLAGALSFLPAYLGAFVTIAVVIALIFNLKKAE